jgi:uncharacterized membrane protein
VVLLAGIAVSYAIGTLFAQQGRVYLADICATLGSIVFGVAIALTGQMYHLSGDFSAGVLLWAVGALIAAALTGSRGALAVALVTACIWNGMRIFDVLDFPNFSFIAFWLVTAALAVVWNAPSARHLVVVSIFTWWGMAAIFFFRFFNWDPFIGIATAGAAFLTGAGLALASRGPQSTRSFGGTLSNYGALIFVITLACAIVGITGSSHRTLPFWVSGSAIAGMILAFAAAAVGRRPGPAVAGISIVLALALAAGYLGTVKGQDPWLGYAVALIAMLCMVVSGMLDDIRPRVVAGWLGLAAAIGAITWAVEGSLLKRAVFLALAGLVAVGLAIALARLKPKESAA